MKQVWYRVLGIACGIGLLCGMLQAEPNSAKNAHTTHCSVPAVDRPGMTLLNYGNLAFIWLHTIARFNQEVDAAIMAHEPFDRVRCARAHMSLACCETLSTVGNIYSPRGFCAAFSAAQKGDTTPLFGESLKLVEEGYTKGPVGPLTYIAADVAATGLVKGAQKLTGWDCLIAAPQPDAPNTWGRLFRSVSKDVVEDISYSLVRSIIQAKLHEVLSVSEPLTNERSE